ncbi:MAG: AAA family ATPase [Ruminococcaceae bacterium]|nr:AAA family ATPase [Oscillospiraceae bacterium]
MGGTQQHRKLKISVAPSHSSKVYTTQTLTFPEFVDTCRKWRVINQPHADFIKLPIKEQKSHKDVGGYVFGSLDETGLRQKEHIKTREGLTYDLDHIDEETFSSIRFMLRESELNYLLHSTASYDGRNMKTRLIIPFVEPLKVREDKNFKTIAKNVAYMLGIPDDDQCSYEDTHMMYWPTRLNNVEPQFIAETECYYLNPNDYKTPSLDRVELSNKEVPESKVSTAIERVSHEEAIEIIKRYVARDRENLQTRDNYFNALAVIIKATHTGEITAKTGEACAKLLARANPSANWEAANAEHFNKELKRITPRTEYTFLSKFDWRPGNAKGNTEGITENDLVRLSDIEPLPVYWLWENYIPYGMLSGLQGDPGSGKTYLSLAICASVSRGETPPNEFGKIETIEPRNILYVNGEDSLQHTIVQRLVHLGADRSRCFTLNIIDKPLDFQQIERIENAVKQINPALVIFDPVQSFLGKGVDMHRANETRPVLNGLVQLADKYNFAGCLVGHMNKYGGGKAQYRGLGSIDFSAVYRTQFLVGDNRNVPGEKLLIQIKNNLGPFAPAQSFKINPNKTLTWTGINLSATEKDVLQEAKAKEGTELQDAIEWLREQVNEAPIWSSDLTKKAKEKGISKRTLERARSVLINSWEIESKKAPGLNKWYVSLHGTTVDFEPGGIVYQTQTKIGEDGEDGEVGEDG